MSWHKFTDRFFLKFTEASIKLSQFHVSQLELLYCFNDKFRYSFSKKISLLRISNFARPSVFTGRELWRREGPYRRVHLRRVATVYGLRRANFTTHKQDAGRESQRPCVTSPSNIDLFATISMLIPHSSSRSSCGARARFARAGGATNRAERGPYDRAYPGIRPVARATAEKRVWSCFADAEQKIRHMTGPPDTLMGLQHCPTRRIIPPSPVCTIAAPLQLDQPGLLAGWKARRERRLTSLEGQN